MFRRSPGSLRRLQPTDTVHAISHLSDLDQSKLLTALPRSEAAKLVDDLPEAQAAQMIERLPVDEAAAIVSELPSNEQADVISRLSIFEASAILDAMPADEARDARRLMAYPPDVAGGLMITEYLSYRDNLSVGDVLDDLRANAEHYRRFDVQYAYVVSPAGKLVGVLRMRELGVVVAARAGDGGDDRQAAARARHGDAGRAGAVLRSSSAVRRAGRGCGRRAGGRRAESATWSRRPKSGSNRSFLRFMGIVGGEELRTMPLRIRCMRRLELAHREHRAQRDRGERDCVSSGHALGRHRAGRVSADHFGHERLLGQSSRWP